MRKKFFIIKKYNYVKRFIVGDLSPLKRLKYFYETKVKDYVPFFMFIAVLVGLLGGLALFVQFFPSLSAPSSITFNDTLNRVGVQLLSARVVSVGDVSQKLHTLVITANVTVPQHTSFVVELYPIAFTPPPAVYVLNYPGFQANRLPKLINSLRVLMHKHQLPVEEVTMSQLYSLPDGAFVIVPTGYLPSPFVAPNSPYFLPTLLSNKDITLLFIGQDVNTMITPDHQTVIVPVNQRLFGLKREDLHSNTLSIKNANVRIFRFTPNDVQYSLFSSGILSGVQIGRSRFVFFPTIVDNPIWIKDSEAFAKDVETVMLTLYTPKSVNNKPVHNTFNVHNGINLWFTPFSTLRKTSVLAVFKTNDTQKNFLFFSSGFDYPCDLYVDGSFSKLPYAFTHIDELLYFDVTPKTCEKRGESYFLQVKDAGGKLVESQYFIARADHVVGEYPFRKSLQFFNVKNVSGYYLFEVVDEIGRQYASSLVHIKHVKVIPEFTRFSSISKLRFFIRDDRGNAIVLPRVHVKMDNHDLGDFLNTDQIVIDFSKSGIAVGRHVFTFTAGDWSYKVWVVKRGEQNILTSPMGLALLGLSGLILVISVMFARKQEKKFYLDVPPFPPFSKVKVPITADKIREVFERVEKAYKWENIPLSIEEIRKGFSDFAYQHKPIFISSYNLQKLFEKAEARGIVASSYGYYALREWLKGRSIEELVLYRKVRNLCVHKTVPFSKLYPVNHTYDVHLKLEDLDVYLHLAHAASFKRQIVHALKNIGKGVNIIVFNDEGEKEELTSFLPSPTLEGVLLKIGMFMGFVKVMTLKELAQFIDDVRGR